MTTGFLPFDLKFPLGFSTTEALQLDGMLVLGVPVSIKRPNDAVSPLGPGEKIPMEFDGVAARASNHGNPGWVRVNHPYVNGLFEITP